MARARRAGSVPPALALAAHFITWSWARAPRWPRTPRDREHGSAVMPFFLALVVGERIRRVELLGKLLVFGGVVVLSAGDLRAGSTHLTGT